VQQQLDSYQSETMKLNNGAKKNMEAHLASTQTRCFIFSRNGINMCCAVFWEISWLLIHFLCNCEEDRSISKGKAAWFLSWEKGICQGKNLCTIGRDALHYELKYINWVDFTSFN
jgi:hypothetical protein